MFCIRSVPQPHKLIEVWKDEFLSPSFMVESTAAAGEANMVDKDVEYQGIAFPVLVQVLLIRVVDKDAVVALIGHIVVIDIPSIARSLTI